MAVVVAACGADQTATPTTPTTTPTSTTAPPPATPTTTTGAVTPSGFAVTPARITLADGTVCELCLWEAATAPQRQRGLMGATDLGDADGMVFVYGAERSSAFWMRDTPLALDIAWFDAGGAFISSATMVPCLSGPDSGCARYGAAAPFTAAVELPAGRLEALEVGPGSVLALAAGRGCDD